MGGIILAQPLGSNFRLPTKEIIVVDSTIKEHNYFTLSANAMQGSERIMLNGVELINDVDRDYIFVDDKTIQLNDDWILEIGDIFSVIYYKK